MRVNLVAGVKEEVKKKKTYIFCFENIRGRTRFEGNMATIPQQRRQKRLLTFLSAITRNEGVPGNGARNACWYFLMFTE